MDQLTIFDESADVVVVGFGAAGTCAAIAARENGADVLALDRANGGGSTAVSGGIIYAGGGTWVQKKAGVSDSYEQMLTYLRLEVGDAVSPQTLESFVAGSPEMIRWLSDYGVPFDSTVCPYKTSYPNNHYYLYHSGSENAGAFRAVTPPVQRGHRVKGKGTSGKKMYGPLAKSALALGARFSPHTTVNKLIQDSGGRVVGVEATTMRHAPARIQQRYSRLAGLSTKPGIYYPPLRALVERRLRALERRYARPSGHRPRRRDRPPAPRGAGPGRLRRPGRWRSRTAGASWPRAPSPTTAASRADRPGPPSAETPSPPEPGRRGWRRDTAPDQVAARPPSHSLWRLRIQRIARWSPGVAPPRRGRRSRYGSVLLPDRSSSNPCGTTRRAVPPAPSTPLQGMTTAKSCVNADLASLKPGVPEFACT